MKQVVICNESFVTHFPEGAIRKLTIQGIEVYCGLIETEDIFFDTFSDDNKNNVLVRKKTFSCNYRDLTIILSAAEHCNANKHKNIFLPFASEFCGEVVAKGSEVFSLEVGDHVMGKGTYPFSGFPGVAGGIPTNNASRELEVFHFGKLMKVPSSMPVETAAAFSLGSQTVYSMIRKLRIKSTDKVLLTAGRSNTSMMALEALRKLNLDISVISSNKEYNSFFEKKGVRHVFNLDINKVTDILEDESVHRYAKEFSGFDCIIDPMSDVYLTKILKLMNSECRYITCGLVNQFPKTMSSKVKPHQISINDLCGFFMLNNIELFYNCLGKDEDLEKAIDDYNNQRYEVMIDSVFTGHDVDAFLERTFNAPDKWGKVIYRYS